MSNTDESVPYELAYSILHDLLDRWEGFSERRKRDKCSFGATAGRVKPASIPQLLELPVIPRGKDELVIAGLGRHMGGSLSFRNSGGEERLYWAGLELVRLSFRYNS